MLNLFGTNAFARKRKTKATPIDTTSRIETLENRIVLASEVASAFSNGNLTLTGSGDADILVVTLTADNTVMLSGTTFTGAGAGPFLVTGNLSISLGNGNDNLTLDGGAGFALDSGNLLIDLGSGNDTSISTGNLTLTGDVTVIGGTGDDTVSLGLVGTFAAQNINIDTGTDSGVSQFVFLDNVTASGNVSITNGGTGAQTTDLGFFGPNSFAGNLVITQSNPANAGGYQANVTATAVSGNVTITNGSSNFGAVIQFPDFSGTSTVGGTTTLTNGNNPTNNISLVGTVGGLQLTGNLKVKNGNATTSNGITVTDLTDSGSTSSSFTNGGSPANTITFDGTASNTFVGLVTALNGASTGTNVITATLLSSTKGLNLTNGTATTSNGVVLGGTAIADAVTVTGNVVITNGAAATNTIDISDLTTNGASAVGNVTINNAATGAGGTGLTFGTDGQNSISGNLQITNQNSIGTRSVVMNQTDIDGRTGFNLYEVGAGNTSLTVGNASLVTILKGLTVQDGSGTAAVSLQNVDLGSLNYSDLGGGTDTINIATAGGSSAQVNGVTRIQTGGGSDIVTIASGGTGIFNDLVFIQLGAGNDSLTIGPNAASPAFSTAGKFQFDGGAGDDTFSASALSLADYQGSPLGKKVKSKINNFETLILT